MKRKFERVSMYSGAMYRMYAEEDSNEGAFQLTKGQRGGLVSDPENIRDNAWVGDGGRVSDKAVVSGNTYITGRVSGSAQVSDEAMVLSNTIVTDQAQVTGYATVHGRVTVGDHAVIRGRANVGAWGSGHPLLILGNTLIEGSAHLSSQGKLEGGHFYGDAVVVGPLAYSLRVPRRGTPELDRSPDISSGRQYLYLGRFGSERVDVALYRAVSGPYLKVGCWDGPLDQLMTEVDRRRTVIWPSIESFTEKDAALMFEQYRSLESIAQLQTQLWEEETR